METERLGKYEILQHIGHGTTGNVWLAKDSLVGRQVALKVVEPETITDLDPFFTEAQLLVRLRHPNIVTINGGDLIDGKVVVDMEYVSGSSLRQVLQKEKARQKEKAIAWEEAFPVNRALKIIAQILNALTYAHELDVIHRDMKPANILIGQNDLVKVVGFWRRWRAGDAGLPDCGDWHLLPHGARKFQCQVRCLFRCLLRRRHSVRDADRRTSRSSRRKGRKGMEGRIGQAADAEAFERLSAGRS